MKTRQRSASAHGRALVEPDRPLLNISPTSLEYQLTASLLNYRQPPFSSPRERSTGSRSKIQQQKSRRVTVGHDIRIGSNGSSSNNNANNNTTTTTTTITNINNNNNNNNNNNININNSSSSSINTPGSTGHRGHRRKRSSKDSCVPDNVENVYRHGRDGEPLESRRRKYSHTTPGELTPTSLPSSPTGTQVQFAYQASLSPSAPASSSSNSEQHQPGTPSGSLFPPASSSQPSLPPKSPKSLIAHYFPSSLPPPPSRNRLPGKNKEPLLAPTPCKTPTFGPALSSLGQVTSTLALPPPSVSYHCVPSTSISHCSTAQPHGHEDNEALSVSSRPSPSTSALGLPIPAARTQPHPLRQHSDSDPWISTTSSSSRGCFHNHPQPHPLARNQHVNNFIHHSNTADDTGASTTIFSLPTPVPASATGQSCSAGPSVRRCSSATAFTTTPIYPSPLADYRHPAIIRLQQKPVPYVRELVPGKEDPGMLTAQTGPPSANTSRDLETVLEEINGRLRTNRTSLDPWSYDACWEEKPLPPLRLENDPRKWVFRDETGIVPGPYFFLLGFLCPVLWWIGSVYPHNEDPKNKGPPSDPQNHPIIQWLQRQLKAAGATIASITMSNSHPIQPSALVATLQIVHISQEEAAREGSTFANVSTIHVPLPPPIHLSSQEPLDTHGPWSAEDHASSVFEQRMEHDRK
ncbi:hypothetical protein BGZ65_008569, partial [Modicella reniformis]